VLLQVIMQSDLIHRIEIAAPAEKIYLALTTEEGIKGWWTVDVKMDSHAGGKAVFSFMKHSVEFQMRIEQLTPPSLVRWQCVQSTSSDWVGTTQEFVLEPQPDGETLIKFCHGGWKSGGDHCYYCNTTWGHLMVSLKNYAEHGVKNPYFT
jgi:uncharacterized protein YndB with AHSA1/START domain